MRLYISWPKNLSAIQTVSAMIYYIYPPFRRLPHDPFLTTGYWVKKHKLMFLSYSPEPVVQIQTGFAEHFRSLAETLSRSENFTHEQFHSELTVLFAQKAVAEHVVTYVFSRKCHSKNHTCFINGTQIRHTEKLRFSLERYDFIEGQKRWRTLLGICGFAVAIMYFSFFHDKPRISSISRNCVSFCCAGEYATDLLFYVHRESFDLGSSFGFGYLACFAFWIPFDFLGFRFDRYSRTMDQNGQFDQPAWFFRWLVVGGMLTGFVSYPKTTFFVRFSYWIPQIIFAAVNNHRKSVNVPFAVLFSAGQLLFTWAIIAYHPIYGETGEGFMIPLAIFVGLQIFAIWLQNTFGGAFFLPERFRIEQFSYHAERPPPNTECVVCLNEIQQNEAFLSTPCHHHFHDACLRTWMDDHQNCPICRAALPALDVDPPEP